MRLLNKQGIASAVQHAHRMKSRKIEVERKFVPTTDFFPNLRTLLGRHNSSTPVDVPKAIIQAHELQIWDTYYEWDDKLWKKGIWIRFRTCIPSQDPKLQSSDWNAKLRLGGDFTKSRMVEVHGQLAVEDVLDEHAPGPALSDLTAYAKFVTTRQAWNIPAPFLGRRSNDDWRMQIVLDKTDGVLEAGAQHFHHEVGEIELIQDIFTDIEKTSLDLAAERMDSHLHLFVSDHGCLFDSKKDAMGKLEAFMLWKAAQANGSLHEMN